MEFVRLLPVVESVDIRQLEMKYSVFTCRGPFHQHVYEKAFSMQIPKAQKDSEVVSVFLRLWDLQAEELCVKC
jgi:hypothetical protein